MFQYMKGSLVGTVIGLLLAAVVGHFYDVGGIAQALFICIVLSMLEVAISFDNAVVNAIVLKRMTPLWQHRFLTWGILIAVFGMRLIFPLLIVAVIAKVSPWDALILAAGNPEEYSRIMHAAHHQVAAFGGAFLMLVALRYFLDAEKDVHWLRVIEEPLARMGRLEAVQAGVTLVVILGMSYIIPDPTHQMEFLRAGLAGVLTFLAVGALESFLEASGVDGDTAASAHRTSAGLFVYLEVLDASFSFDGVIGAFAITNNLFLIAIGLGIGALFVRSLTIMMVDKGTLAAYKFLEHGAFYAVWGLSLVMFFGVVVHIPEWLAGVMGFVFIGGAVWASIRERNREEHEAHG